MTATLDGLENPQELQEPETPVAPAIPEGWVKDRETGQYRPPKRRGRKAAATPPPSEHDAIERGEDVAPDSRTRGKSAKGVPRWKAGVIAKGMAQLYRRTGRIVKAMDRDIGIAIIESADDCGEAWDDLARTNPRIRAALLKMITGGSWAGLLWAHAPIFLAVLMKERIRNRIPFGKFIGTLLEDEDGPTDISAAMGNMTPDDLQQVMAMATQMMGPIMGQMNGNGAPE